MEIKKTELEELTDRLASRWSSTDKHYEIVFAEKLPNGNWSLEIKEIKDEEESSKEGD